MGGHDFLGYGQEQARMPIAGGATAVALGIEVKGGVFVPLIARGTPVPCQHTEAFTTGENFQPHIKITVYRGDSGRVVENQRIGEYELSLSYPGPRGTVAVAVTFGVDPHGEFRLTATDSGSGRPVPVRMSY